MKACMLAPFIAACTLVSGCTNAQLRHNTVFQTGTSTEVQHEVVLANLAVFAFNSDSIPFHATLTDGTAQITDNGSIATQLLNATSRTLTLGATRSATDQWTMVPVSDSMSIRLLRTAYRRAIDGATDLYTPENFANELAHELKKQAVQVDDLRTTNQIGNTGLQGLVSNGVASSVSTPAGVPTGPLLASGFMPVEPYAAMADSSERAGSERYTVLSQRDIPLDSPAAERVARMLRNQGFLDEDFRNEGNRGGSVDLTGMKALASSIEKLAASNLTSATLTASKSAVPAPIGGAGPNPALLTKIDPNTLGFSNQSITKYLYEAGSVVSSNDEEIIMSDERLGHGLPDPGGMGIIYRRLPDWTVEKIEIPASTDLRTCDLLLGNGSVFGQRVHLYDAFPKLADLDLRGYSIELWDRAVTSPASLPASGRTNTVVLARELELGDTRVRLLRPREGAALPIPEPLPGSEGQVIRVYEIDKKIHVDIKKEDQAISLSELDGEIRAKIERDGRSTERVLAEDRHKESLKSLKKFYADAVGKLRNEPQTSDDGNNADPASSRLIYQEVVKIDQNIAPYMLHVRIFDERGKVYHDVAEPDITATAQKSTISNIKKSVSKNWSLKFIVRDEELALLNQIGSLFRSKPPITFDELANRSPGVLTSQKVMQVLRSMKEAIDNAAQTYYGTVEAVSSVSVGEVDPDGKLKNVHIRVSFPRPLAYTEHKIKLQCLSGKSFETSSVKELRYVAMTPLVVELRRQIAEIEQTLLSINNGWLHYSRNKHDIADNACYQTVWKDCNGLVYAWVCQDGKRDFEEFTIKILKLSSLIKSVTVSGSAGVKFTPGSAAATLSPGK